MPADGQREIVDLHVFLAGWLSGRLEPTAGVFARFEDALDPSFRIISPRGVVTPRATLAEELWSSHGAAGPDFKIEIRAVQHVEAPGDVVIFTYEEWQRGKGDPTARISTVIFRRDPAGPNGVRWLHLHETWTGH